MSVSSGTCWPFPLRIFILTARLQIAYDRWWEGGTLLQKTRGEWFLDCKHMKVHPSMTEL